MTDTNVLRMDNSDTRGGSHQFFKTQKIQTKVEEIRSANKITGNYQGKEHKLLLVC